MKMAKLNDYLLKLEALYSKHDLNWGGRRGLNPRPPVPQTGALTN